MPRQLPLPALAAAVLGALVGIFGVPGLAASKPPCHSNSPNSPCASSTTTTTTMATTTATTTTTTTPTQPSETGAPTISGAAVAGQVLTASTGSWSGTSPLAYSYQWKRCDSTGSNCSAIANATDATYTLGSSDVGAVDRVSVTASNTAGASSADSAPTALVEAGSAIGGNTYWVSTSGSDLAAGSLASPWRTITHALSIAGAGDTVIVTGGTYGEDVKVDVSGSAGSPVTLRANWGDTVTVRSFNVAASHVVLAGFDVTGATGPCVTVQPALTDVTVRDSQIHGCGSDGLRFVRTTTLPYTTNSLLSRDKVFGVGTSDTSANDMEIYANYLTVAGCDLSGSPNDAIDMWGDHLTFRGNYIHDISNSYGHHNDAFQTWNGLNDGAEGNPVTNLLVERNHIANIAGSDAHGFMVEGAGNNYWTVRDNVIENIGSIGMILGVTGSANSSLGLEVYNNTFVNAGPQDVVEFNSKDTGTFSNNILQGGGGLYITSGTSVVHDYNIFSSTGSNAPLGPHDQKVAPGFVNAGDYHLVAGSPAVDAGDNGNIDPLRPLDYDGNPNVGVVDVGAYEYQG